MIDHEDALIGMGGYESEYEKFLDELADERAEDEYWELRFRELQHSAVDEKAWAI